MIEHKQRNTITNMTRPSGSRTGDEFATVIATATAASRANRTTKFERRIIKHEQRNAIANITRHWALCTSDNRYLHGTVAVFGDTNNEFR